MIIRVRKASGTYAIIDSRPTLVRSLSYKALGLYYHLMTKPDEWEINVADLVASHSDGRESVQSGLQELKAHGYAALVWLPGDNGKKAGTRWILAEQPGLLDSTIAAEGLKRADERESRLSEPTNGKPVGRESRLLSNTGVESITKDTVEDFVLFSEDVDTTLSNSRRRESNGPSKAEIEAERVKQAEAIYAAYPKKVNKVAAIKEIKKALKLKAYEYLLERVELYAIARAGKDPTYTVAPDTFFAKGKYDDDANQWTDTPRNEARKANGFRTQAQEVPHYMSLSERRKLANQ